MPCGSDSYDCPHCDQRDVPNCEAVRVGCPGPDACRMYHAHYEIVHTDCPSAGLARQVLLRQRETDA